MMPQCRPWLPDSAIAGEQTLARAADCLAQWSARWLATGGLVPLGGWQPHQAVTPPDDRRYNGGIAITCRDEERLALASLLLGTQVRARNLRTREDAAVIDGLLGDALDDLGSMLAAAFASQPAQEVDTGERRYRLLCGDGGAGEPLLAISLSADLLVTTLLRAAPRARIAPGTRPLNEAWSGQDVSVGALLGACRVPLGEIERLQAGDVVVLDRGLGTPLDLTIDDIIVASGAALVTPAGNTQSLVIERPADQW